MRSFVCFFHVFRSFRRRSRMLTTGQCTVGSDDANGLPGPSWTISAQFRMHLHSNRIPRFGCYPKGAEIVCNFRVPICEGVNGRGRPIKNRRTYRWIGLLEYLEKMSNSTAGRRDWPNRRAPNTPPAILSKMAEIAKIDQV
jgi:hypothetical protein